MRTRLRQLALTFLVCATFLMTAKAQPPEPSPTPQISPPQTQPAPEPETLTTGVVAIPIELAAPLAPQFGFLRGSAAEGKLTLVVPRAVQELHTEKRTRTTPVTENGVTKYVQQVYEVTVADYKIVPATCSVELKDVLRWDGAAIAAGAPTPAADLVQKFIDRRAPVLVIESLERLGASPYQAAIRLGALLVQSPEGVMLATLGPPPPMPTGETPAPARPAEAPAVNFQLPKDLPPLLATLSFGAPVNQERSVNLKSVAMVPVTKEITEQIEINGETRTAAKQIQVMERKPVLESIPFSQLAVTDKAGGPLTAEALRQRLAQPTICVDGRARRHDPVYLVTLSDEVIVLQAAQSARAIEQASVAAPASAPLAHFTFNGHAKDEQGQAEFELQNTEFRENALYLNGVYQLGPDSKGYRAVCRTPSFRFTAFTAAVRFQAEEFTAAVRFDALTSTKSSLLIGGTSYRWFGLQRSAAGNLEVMFNNGKLRHEIPGAPLEAGRWTVVLCGVDLAGRKVVVYVDGKKVDEFDLPADFTLEVIGSPEEATDKVWAFANYSNANCFHGLVDELVIYNRLLTPAEIEQTLRQIPKTQGEPSASATPKPASVPASDEFLSQAERQMLDMVNRERFKAGLPPLKANRKLTDAARGHAANMARRGTLNHTLGGRTFDQRIDATGYRHWAAGENIFAGAGASQAMSFWMRSPGHRGNILNRTYQEIGIGAAATNSGQQYWTQVFAAPATPPVRSSGLARPR